MFENALRRRRSAGPLFALKMLAQIEARTAKILEREERKDQEYVSSFLAQLRAKAIESMHALLEADADDDDA